MYWKEDDESSNTEIGCDIVDISFKIECAGLPADHSYALYTELVKLLPWFADGDSGMHLVHITNSVNGWHRPEQSTTSIMLPSKRTKLTLRIGNEKLDETKQTLDGAVLLLQHQLLEQEFQVKLSKPSVKYLSEMTTLQSRHVLTGEDETEDDFLARTGRALEELGISVKKMVCGKRYSYWMPEKMVFARSLLLADLKHEDAAKLQKVGLGKMQKFGFGLFIPHKEVVNMYT